MSGTITMTVEEYDALRAEAEALWSTYIALVDKLGIDTEKAKTADGKPSDVIVSYVEALRAEIEELDALRNRQSDLLSQTAIALRGPEPPLTRYSHADIPSRVKTVVAELEAARGLLEQRIPCDVMLPPATTIKRGCPLSTVLTSMKMREDAPPNQRVFHPAPVVQAEQGERQEAVAWLIDWPDEPELGHYFSEEPNEAARSSPLYTTPQPGPDVRGLAASLYQACGAYDMPERILDALSAAASGEPFTHMIDGLLPCVPPSEQDVRSLVEALENCAAALAWNCFGECRAVHAGPIMPAAKALDTARTALAAHRQAQRQ